MLVRLSSKGQLVIPKTIRHALRLRSGFQFRIHVEKGKIILEPIIPSPIDSLYGKYPDSDFLSGLEEEHQKEITDDKQIRS